MRDLVLYPCVGLLFAEMHSGKSSSVRLRIRRWFGCVYDIVYFMPLLICTWSSPRTRAGDRSSRFDGWDGDGPLGLGCWDWQKMKHKWKSALNNKCSRAGLLKPSSMMFCRRQVLNVTGFLGCDGCNPGLLLVTIIKTISYNFHVKYLSQIFSCFCFFELEYYNNCN